MSVLSVKELREKSDAELGELLIDSRRTQLKFRIQKSTDNEVASHGVRQEKKNVARIKTILNERKLQAQRGDQ